MELEITPIAGSISESAIRDFEENIGMPFPPDYREFMLKYNGGDPLKCVFKFQDATGPYSDSIIRYFFAFSDDYNESIKHNHEIYTLADRVPKNILPIAEDPGGNIVCLSLAGDDVGKVYFWDHEQEGLTEASSTYENLELIANSFTEFVDGLEEESY